MRYIDIKHCLEKIDETRIDRENANVYLGSTDKEIVLEFAYSESKKDHIVLKKDEWPINASEREDIWIEYLAVSMIIEHSYKVRRFIDDIRKKRRTEIKTVVSGLELFSSEQKNKFFEMAEIFLSENKLECLKIDRDRFTYSGKEHKVKIYFQPFNKKMVSREELTRAKLMENIVITNDRYSKRKRGTVIPTRENGYIWFRVGEEDA